MCAIPAVCVPPTPQVKKSARLSQPCFWADAAFGRSKIVCCSAIKMELRWVKITMLRYPDLKMRRSLHLPIAPGKKLAALFCLFSVLLIWAPAWASVIQSQQMDCCADGLCPAHGGHHNKSSEPVSHPAQSPMDCDHHDDSSQKSSGLAACSLSCCHDLDHPTTAAAIFVLPALTQIAEPAVALAPISFLALTNFAHVSDPLSPPPRA